MKRLQIAFLMRAHGLQAPYFPKRQRGSKAHEGIVTTSRPDEMWGTDATATLTVKEGAAFVFISDPASQPDLAPDILRATYGLTRSEARLAILLAGDRSLAEAADELSVSIHTVRKQLQSLFAKTGTHRQSSLVGLLVRSAAALRPPDTL